jgi:NAD-dependent dihydropyrimidine dehydrogenase PreA subunit
MSEPKRPTCGTCVHFVKPPAEFGINPQRGTCIRMPPQMCAESGWNGRPGQESVRVYEGSAGFRPLMWESQSCGEHPDFPAYLRAWQAERQAGEGAESLKPECRHEFTLASDPACCHKCGAVEGRC